MAAAISCFLSVLFVCSAVAKLRQPTVFWGILRQFAFGPLFWSVRAAMVVPVLELAIAVGLCLGPPWSLAALAGAVGLLGAGAAGIALRFLAGEKTLACGCFGALGIKQGAPYLLGRNAVLLGASLFVSTSEHIRFEWTEWLAGAGLLLALELIEAAMLQRERILQWKAAGSLPT